MNGFPMAMALDGAPIQVCKHLAGRKRAIFSDGVIFVSPAMMDLIQNSEGDELQRVLEAIKILDLDKIRERLKA